LGLVAAGFDKLSPGLWGYCGTDLGNRIRDFSETNANTIQG
jgi:hypothetical protein